MDQDETWHGGRPRPWLHCVRWGPGSPTPKGIQPPFSAHVGCGQMAGWMKMPHGMKVGVGPNHTVRWGPAPPPKERGAQPPIFGPIQRRHFWLQGFKVCCHGNQVLAKLGKNLTKIVNFTCVRHINAVLFGKRVSAIGEFICETTLLKGQTGVTMATNFGTKIAISAFLWKTSDCKCLRNVAVAMWRGCRLLSAVPNISESNKSSNLFWIG